LGCSGWAAAGRVDRAKGVDVLESSADTVDVEQVPEDDLRAEFTQHVGSGVFATDHRTYGVVGVLQRSNDLAAGRSGGSGYEDP
jgi:hypothetical protein